MQGPYDVILADPPWSYYGDPHKDQAAGKHYPCMDVVDLVNLPIPRITAAKAVLFLWATCPRLPFALELMDGWDFYFRGVAFVWIKTTKAGGIISGQGIRPTVVKPTTEFVLVGTTCKTGRALPLRDEGIGQVVWEEAVEPEPVLAPRPGNRHSKKPDEVRRRIEALFAPDVRRIELFAREQAPGWDAWGNEL